MIITLTEKEYITPNKLVQEAIYAADFVLVDMYGDGLDVVKNRYSGKTYEMLPTDLTVLLENREMRK